MTRARPIQLRGFSSITPLLCLVLMISGIAARGSAPAIRLNTLGFLPDQPKQASIIGACTNFTLVRQSDGREVFKGVVIGPRHNADTSEELYHVDFSAYREPGVFQLDVPGVGRSTAFPIASNVYEGAFCTVMRGMYLWRCGTAVSATVNGKTFSHGACHTNDAWLDYATGEHRSIPSPGGWHDAGDYNKYVVNAAVALGTLFRSWEDFGDAIRQVERCLPDRAGSNPDFLAELKWEVDWLLTMQAPDGSVYHKVSTRHFGAFIPPETEETDRYFAPWSSGATAQFAAVVAMGARCFRAVDPAFAKKCEQAAQRGYSFLVEHPANHRADLSAFTTGGYQTRDADARLWAAAELWESTGNSEAKQDFEARSRAAGGRVDVTWDYGNVKTLGQLTYLFSKRAGRDPELLVLIQSNVLSSAMQILHTRDGNGYGRTMGSLYTWGGNGLVARQTMVLMAAYRVSHDSRFRNAALDALGYLFGRNVFGRSFVTGLGSNPPQHPHDRRSGAKDRGEAWPGYLVGGPNPRATGWRDVQEDYRVNEIAINWNAALLYALAAFLPGATQ